MIIGVTGPIASGKTIFSDMLLDRGFIRLSLSEEVRDEVRKRGMPVERTVLQNVGNELRKKFGNGYWAKKLLLKTEKGKNYIIEGIRNPGEIEELRKNRDFILIGVDAPLEDRVERIIARDKDSDPKTREGILQIEARDRGVGEGNEGQQVWACFEMADAILLNNTNLDDLKEKAKQLIDELGC